ncbi:MAG: signal recognition particle-docking protein FtsY [Clostridia bacterium]
MEQKLNLFKKLKNGLEKTRNGLFAGLFGSDNRIDAAFYDELEEALITADVGLATADKLLARLRDELEQNKLHTRSEARDVLRGILADMMRQDDIFLCGADKAVLLIVGVNGVGKTTSVGKLASWFAANGRRPMLAAADTFRAAAAEQLTVWAKRADVPIIKHNEGADPAAVVFDAIASFKAKGLDVLLCDTAGRLHNKKNLMNELEKIRRVIDRELPECSVEVLLVLDATTGQNAIAQAKAFGESTGLTGIILTKLDGTAKGGVAVAIREELNLPVRFVGVGEGIDDLQPFDAQAYAAALL